MDPYLSEQLAGPKNQLQISSICNAKCIFCSNDQNPFKIRREHFRKLEDVKEAIKYLEIPEGHNISIGDALPGRISEGEAFLHPDIFEILGLIRKSFKDIIEISTNASMLTEEFLDELKKYNPIEVTVSYHSDDMKNWMDILKLSEKQFHTAKNSFKLMRERDISVEGAIVPMVKMVGWDDVDNSISWMSKFVRRIIVWPPGFTKITKPEEIELMDVNYLELSKFFIAMRKKYYVDIKLLTDMLEPIKFYPKDVMIDSYLAGYRRVGWMLSEAAFFRASNMIEASSLFAPNNHFPYLTKNYTYEGNIVCAGLLMVNDFRIAISKAIEKDKIDLAILPGGRNTDINKNDLTNESYDLLTKEFKIPIWYA